MPDLDVWAVDGGAVQCRNGCRQILATEVLFSGGKSPCPRTDQLHPFDAGKSGGKRWQGSPPSKHLARWKTHGDANIWMPPRRGHHEVWSYDQWVAAFRSRFVRMPNGCLEWQGSRVRHGYGRFIFDGKQWFTHRLAYTLSVGPIPDGLNVCHHCDNPPCGEPTHLFVGDNAANLEDMRRKGRGFVPDAPRGSAHLKTSLTEEAVVAIRQANADGESQSAIARRLGISRVIVAAICTWKTWKHAGGSETPRQRRGDRTIVPLRRTGPLTDSERAEIRASAAMGVDLARLYGVSPATICTIRRGYVRNRPPTATRPQ
jgi:hypothetical protein